MTTLSVGDRVVIPREPALGVGRVERLLDVDGTPSARILCYDDGRYVIRALGDVAPCPPGVWERAATKRSGRGS